MAPDISGMPDPSKIGLKPDISEMPSPQSLGLYSARAPAPRGSNEAAAEGEPSDPYAGASTGASEAAISQATGALGSTVAAVPFVARRLVHLLGGGLGYGLAAGDPEKTQQVTDWLQKKSTEDTQSFDDIQKFLTYAPRTPEGQAANEGVAKVAGQLTRPSREVLSDIGVPSSITSKIPAPGPGTETALDIGGGALRAASALPAVGLAGDVAAIARTGRRAAAAGEAATGARAAEAVKPSTSVTAAQLRAQPNPIPPPGADAATAPSTLAVQKPKISPRAGESAQEAATRQGTPAPAPESSAAPAPAPAARPPLQQGSDAAQGLYEAEVARLAGTAPAPATPAPAPATPAPAAAQRGSIFANRQAGAARLFHPPQEDGPQYAARASETEQDTRRSTLADLNRLGGGTMTHHRRGAVTGDWEQTGNEHQTAKMPDAPGQLLRDQIASEHQTLHNAIQSAHDVVGSEARNDIDRDTLEQRGGAVRGAVHAIEDHFNGAANGMYQTARAVLGDRTMPSMPRVQQILSDASHDVNPTAGSLRRAAQTKLQQLWSVGDTRGNVKTAPGSVGAAERFHEFLNDSYHNDSSGLIRKLKSATDMDVAERAGGNDMFQAARSVIQHRETMLEPDGVNELRRPKDRNKIDHEVPLHEVMDHVTNQDREHFEHVMNVLRAGAHLSPEVAEKSAAAIREIQGHMISKLHAAARGEAGQWNATNFYKAANRFSTNMPAAFKENPGVMADLQTINRAGNILKMDKSYPGAVSQAAKVGLIPSLATKAIKGAKAIGEVGGVAHGNIVAAGIAHLGGKALEKGVKSLTERSRLATARESLEPLGAIRGNKERGAVGDLSQRDAIEHDSFSSEGSSGIIHHYSIPGDKGELRTIETPGLGVRKAYKSNVDPDLRGQGWGTRMLQRAVDDAHKAGQVWHSDDNVSKSQVGAYKNLAQLGYKVTEKGNTKHTGSWQAWGDHVFEVRPRGPGPGKFERGSVQVTRGPKGEAPLAGAPEGDRPNATARNAAAAYAKSAGIARQPLTDYRYVQPAVAKDVADAYDKMPHNPSDPKVKAAYDAFKAETLAQYKQMQKAGVNVTLDKDYPYKVPREVQEDVRNNKHMSIFPTEQGFGEVGSTAADHPMLERAPIQMSGKPATYNDLFRAVHDYYGHVAEGNGFRANGEYNAWRSHRTMYSPVAQPAMDSETLGQNSWVNSGPHAQGNAGASQTATTYAEQKAGLLPPKVVKEAEQGVSADEHHITSQLTEPERAQLRANTTKRLIDQFHALPDTPEFAAAALAGKAKRGWYRASAEAISNTFGPDAPRFSAVLSAMSPQQSVQANFHNALRTFVNWDKAGRPTDPAAIKQIMQDSVQRQEGGKGVLLAWENNTIRALTADDPTKIALSGPKVHSFYHNLMGHTNEVTNDAWMAAFSKIDPSAAGTKMSGTLNKSGPGKTPTYLAMSAKVRAAAKMLSNMTGETWTPAEVQETVWSWAKTAYEHSEELGDHTIPELVKHGKLTDELIRSTPDFHQLFSTPEHRGFLARSRYAEGAKRLVGTKGTGPVPGAPSKASAAAEHTLHPFLMKAADRLESMRQERSAARTEEAPF